MTVASGTIVDDSAAPVERGPTGKARTFLPHRHGPALAGYLLLTGVFFWPAVRHLPTRILSDAGDGASYLWNLWAIPRSVLAGDNPFVTRDLFHPIGALTAFNTNMPLLGVVSWPFQKLFGLAVAANLVELAAVVLSGFAAYLLALHACGDRRAAFVAGAAFTFAPYHFAHVGHFSLFHLEFLPLGLLALLRLYDRPSRGLALAFGAVGGLTFLTDLYYAVFLLLAAGVVAAWHWRRTATREMALRLGQSGLVAVVIGLPLLAAMARELVVFQSLDPLTNWANADNYSADLLSWVTPSVLQRVWGHHFVGVDRAVTGGERLAFAGFTVLGRPLGGAVLGGKRRRGLWVMLALVFFVLSLGPFLHVNGATGGRFEYFKVRFSVPLPYFGLHFVPVLNGVRVPGRFSIVGILALDVLAALALARLGRGRPRLAWAAPAVALVLVLVEFWPRLVPTQPAAIPAPYEAIAAEPGRGAVLEIPLQWRTGFAVHGDATADHTIFMYYATRHGKPLVGGMVARYPHRRMAQLLSNPVYQDVLDLQRPQATRRATFTAADLRALRIGYVVYHRGRANPSAQAYVAGLGLPELADDGTIQAWKVP
jgi:hypothetical protein